MTKVKVVPFTLSEKYQVLTLKWLEKQKVYRKLSTQSSTHQF